MKISTRALNSRERMLFLGALVAYALLFTKNFVFVHKKALVALKDESLKLDERLASLNSIKASAQARKKIVPAMELADVPGALVNPIYLSGINLLHSQFLKSIIEGAPESLTSTLRLTGSFKDLTAYVKYLESLAPPLAVKKFFIEKDEADPNLLRVEITGVTYGAL